jgi:hypothetical protein
MSNFYWTLQPLCSDTIPRWNNNINNNNNNKHVLSEKVYSGNGGQYIKHRFPFSFHGNKRRSRRLSQSRNIAVLSVLLRWIGIHLSALISDEYSSNLNTAFSKS